MSGHSSISGGSAERITAIARALLAAEDVSSALSAWLCQPPVVADFVAVIDSARGEVRHAFRSNGSGFRPLPLPPVASGRRPAEPHRIDLAQSREDAFDDLLYSLGLEHLLILPLRAEGAGWLAVARTSSSFTAGETDSLLGDAALVGPYLAQLARRLRRQEQESSSSREVAELFDLTRELARVVDPARALHVAVEALRRQLRPHAGALSVELAGGEDALIESWPGSREGQRAAAVAAGAQEPGAGCWVIPQLPDSSVKMALTWKVDSPASAERFAGAALAALSMAVDRLESQRQREEGRLRETVEGLPLGAVLLDGRGRVRFANGAARDLLEALDAWPGVFGRLSKLGSVELTSMIAEAREGLSASAEVYFPNGHRTLEVRVVPAHRTQDSEAHLGPRVLVVLDDVTEVLRQRKQLIQAEKLSALGTLISGVVHELNNPLSTVLGYSQMLIGMPEAPTRVEWIKMVHEEGQRCHRIVNNMLALARRHEGGQQLVSLKALAEKALSLVAYPYRTAGIESSLRVDSDTPALRGDQDALLQVLINLLTNAMHALETHTGKREVRVEIGPDGADHMMLVVADSGPGIPEDLKKKVFDPFFTTKEEGKGTGLGLSQVASTIADHKGTMQLDSRDGGAVFRIRLPAADLTAVEEPAERSADKPPVTFLACARIMVIDDEPAVADCLAEVLGHAGARVEVFTSGRQALEAIEKNAPDVIVTDVKMPRVSGETIFLELERNSPQLVDRLIFTTGDLQAASHAPVLKRSSRPCLPKPFDFKQVLRVVGEIYHQKTGPLVPLELLHPERPPGRGSEPIP